MSVHGALAVGPRSQVIRFQIPGTDPGFAEAFENYFGRPYDEEEAEAVYSKVGKGPKSGTPKNLLYMVVFVWIV